ncbi:MAG TPA: hypothetical protein VD886_22775, partial [Herpetosiphonaceae bacterium]|nr:hypothetical protein [Herpetosiphonaceae bacterium]
PRLTLNNVASAAARNQRMPERFKRAIGFSPLQNTCAAGAPARTVILAAVGACLNETPLALA